jgi:hypothetical protein
MAAKPYEWHIMLYLSGDNSLSEEMVRALKDIRLQGVPDKVAFTVQYDPRSPFFETALYAITASAPPARSDRNKALPKESELLPVANYVVRTVPGEDSATPGMLAGFIKWSVRRFDAKYRMLILSGHGSGAVGDFLSDERAKQGQPNSFTIPRLAEALDAAQKGLSRRLRADGDRYLLHVLGMDSCLMGMAEVCHQLRRHVQYLVGSEGFVPNAGWPYAFLLKKLSNRPGTAEAMAERLVSDVVSCQKAYVPAGLSFDMAACELQTIPNLATTVRSLSDSLVRQIDDPRVQDLVVAAHWRAQSYKFEQHTDLWDFCDQLQQALDRAFPQLFAPIKRACSDVKNAVDAAVGDRTGFAGAEFQHSHGLSVFFPWSTSVLDGGSLKNYSKLSFARVSGWSRFLKLYLEKTRRLERPKPAEPAIRVSRFVRRGPFGGGLAFARSGEPANRSGEPANRSGEPANRAAEGAALLITRLYSGPGLTLPGSMKNPADVVWVTLGDDD